MAQDNKKHGLMINIGLIQPKGAPPKSPWQSQADGSGDHPEPDADDMGQGPSDNDEDDQQGDSQVFGEPKTGYSGPENGPFACQNCEYFDPSVSSCHQPTMMQDSQQPKAQDGSVQVDPEGCCTFFHPGGASAHDQDEMGPGPSDHPDNHIPPDYNA